MHLNGKVSIIQILCKRNKKKRYNLLLALQTRLKLLIHQTTQTSNNNRSNNDDDNDISNDSCDDYDDTNK